jgi:hypothetical protein
MRTYTLWIQALREYILDMTADSVSVKNPYDEEETVTPTQVEYFEYDVIVGVETGAFSLYAVNVFISTHCRACLQVFVEYSRVHPCEA